MLAYYIKMSCCYSLSDNTSSMKALHIAKHEVSAICIVSQSRQGSIQKSIITTEIKHIFTRCSSPSLVHCIIDALVWLRTPITYLLFILLDYIDGAVFASTIYDYQLFICIVLFQKRLYSTFKIFDRVESHYYN